MTDIRGSPISDFELEFGLWSCHCCGKVNDIKRSKCIICGREAGYRQRADRVGACQAAVERRERDRAVHGLSGARKGAGVAM